MFRLKPSSGQDKVKFHYLLILCEFQIIISLYEIPLQWDIIKRDNNLELTQYQ
jgi:hypothetical protein